MKRLQFLFSGALVTVVCTLAAPDSAIAKTLLYSPFGSAPVTVKIGKSAQAPVQYVVWQRNSDRACQFTVIGNGSGLFDDYAVFGSPFADHIEVVRPDLVTTFCNALLRELIYGGHFLDLFGGDGNDGLYSLSTGDTSIFGGNGNDDIISAGSGAYLYGGDGNDDLIATHLAVNDEHLYGGAGYDCLEDRSGAATVVDCGSGDFDILVTLYGEPMSRNCEFRHAGNCS
jgi:hypothetical protein